MDSLEELLDIVLEWSFVPVALSILLLSTWGSGLLRVRWRRTAWIAVLVLFSIALYFGVDRHEWGEVLFNGQLL